MSSPAPVATKKHFTTATALRHFTPAVLSEFFHEFPDYLKSVNLSIPKPDEATTKSMPYDSICAACMAPNIDPRLNRILFMATHLGNEAGWEQIQAELAFRSLKPEFPAMIFTHHDLPLKVWLQGRPDHPDILEQSYARVRVHSKSSYRYYAPTRDLRSKYKKPTAEILLELRNYLAQHFTNDPNNEDVTVLVYDYEEEIWFLVRYPGHPVRPDAIGKGSRYDDVFYTPGQYDAVVYHKTFGDLRMNTVRKKERAPYRIALGHALLDQANAFDPKRKIITLAPVLGPCRHIFAKEDGGEFPRVLPIEICFHDIMVAGKRITWRIDDDKGNLLQFPCKEDPMRLIPSTADAIHYAKFRYRLKDSDTWHSMTVHQGMELTFERDGDSAVLEYWLRKWGFIVDVLAKTKLSDRPLEAAGALS